MTTPYSYIPSTDYINNLTYDYVETYSFRRGIEYDEKAKSLRIEYENLKTKKGKDGHLSVQDAQKFDMLKKLFDTTQYILTPDGQFHFSSKLTNTFRQNDREFDFIKDMLQIPIEYTPMFMCAPDYKDAIVFYEKNGHIVSTLNICLSCMYMETKMFNHINADYKTYDSFKKFFIDIGHDVEDPTSFITDDINRYKA